VGGGALTAPPDAFPSVFVADPHPEPKLNTRSKTNPFALMQCVKHHAPLFVKLFLYSLRLVRYVIGREFVRGTFVMKFFIVGLVIFYGASPMCFAQSATAVLSRDELQFFQVINRFRAMLSLPKLAVDARLEGVARAHSIWMDNALLLSHDEGPNNTISPFDRMASAGYTGYTYEGENVACGYGGATETFRQWAFSPDHLQNMVNPHYHDMGIARAGTGNEHCPFYWTNDFGSTTDVSLDPPGTTDVTQIAQAIAAVSGAIPATASVSLTEPDSSPTPNPVSVTSGSNASDMSGVNCNVPYALGRGILTQYPNNDTSIAATQNSDGSYSMTLSYVIGNQVSPAYPISINGVTLTRNSDFPIATLISPRGSKLGGFSIELDLATGSAQFDSIGVEPEVTGKISCRIN